MPGLALRHPGFEVRMVPLLVGHWTADKGQKKVHELRPLSIPSDRAAECPLSLGRNRSPMPEWQKSLCSLSNLNL